MARILVVDDDAAFRFLIVPALEEAGHAVLEAGSAAEAATRLSGSKADALVVDAFLPDRTGMDFLVGVRQANDLTPAILISAFWRRVSSVERLARELRVARVLTKPLTAQELVSAITDILAQDSSEAVGGNASAALVSPKPTPAATREKMATLRGLYAERLADQLDELDGLLELCRSSAMAAAAREEAYQLAHRIHGTAASYGFAEAGIQAAKIEDLLAVLIRDDGTAPPSIHDDLQAALAAAQKKRTAQDADPSSDGDRTSGVTRILLVDDNVEVADRMRALLEEQVARVFVAHNAEEALLCAQTETLDCAVLNAILDGGPHGFTLAHAIRDLPGLNALPLGFIATWRDIDMRITAAHAGASILLEKPPNERTFAASVLKLGEATKEGRPRVLIVDDDRFFAFQVQAILEEEHMMAETLRDPRRILESLDGLRPDIVLLDMQMPSVSGVDVCKMLRITPDWQNIPIIFVTASGDPETRSACFRAGGSDLIQKPIVREELLARVQSRLLQTRLLREREHFDPLTGLLRRGPFIARVAELLEAARRRHEILCVSLVDLDRFRVVNDFHGFSVGDRILADLGRLFASRLRCEDLRGRWGGSEFVIAWPGETREVSKRILERLLRELAGLIFTGETGEPFGMTFSAGVASFPNDGVAFEDLIRAAQRRLYMAKQAGRNRVEM